MPGSPCRSRSLVYSWPLLGLAALATHLAPLHAAPDTVDATFAASAGQIFDASHYGGIASILVQPDGKIVFGSNEMPGTVDGNPLRIPLIRVDPDGTVDNTFFADNDPNGSGLGIYYDTAGWPEVHALGLDSTGKIIAAGVMQGMRDGTNELRSNSIVRINPDGTLDTGFQTAGTVGWPVGGFNYIEDLTVQTDDKVIAVGGFGGIRNSLASPAVTRHGIARFNTDGSLDTGFAIQPAQFGVPAGAANVRGFFRQAALNATGKLYVVGSLEWGPLWPAQSVQIFARLYPDGARDFSFNPVVPGNVEQFEGVAVEPNGDVTVLARLVGGTSWMKRFTAAGAPAAFTLDPSLSAVTARPLQRDPNGKFLLATAGPGAAYNRLVRIHNDGSLDATFDATATFVAGPNGAGPGYFNAFTTAPSGKIYSGSFFDTVNGVSTKKVVAFEGDFTPGSPGTIQFAASVFWTTETAGSVRIPVTRTGGTTGAASATFTITAGTATAADFTPVTTTVTFPAGVGGTRHVTIPITADALVEGIETASLTLSGFSGASAGGVTAATLTILDSDSPPRIVLEPQPVFVPPGQPFTLSVAVESGADPVTYQWFRGGSPVPGATTAQLAVAAADPALHNGSYTVTVSNPNGPTPSQAALVTVKNPAILGLTAATFEALENAGNVAVTLSRTGSSVGAVSVELAAMAVTALSPEDFTAGVHTVSWADGDAANKTVNIPLANDALVEPPETFTITLSEFSPDAIAGATTTATITIRDDDSPLQITAQPLSQTVGEGGTATFTVTATSQSPLSYQWFLGNALIPGATSATYEIAGVLPGNSGNYRVEVTNAAGTVPSETAVLFVAPGPALIPPGFVGAPALNGQVRSIAVLPDGDALVGGDFTSVGGDNTQRYLTKLNSAGFPQEFFAVTLDGSVRAIAVQPDGKIVIGGDFFNVNGTPSRHFARLNADGSTDTDFAANIGTRFPSTVVDVDLLPDGRIVAAGSFTHFNNQPSTGYLAVFHADGTLDTGFASAANNQVAAIDVQPDGKILAAGWFTWQGANRIVRLFPDGSRDPSFQSLATPGANASPADIAALPDGRIALVGGNLSNFSSFLLLDANGNLTKNVTSANGYSRVAAQADGKILTGGSFTGGLSRWTTTGNPDTTFNSAGGTRLAGSTNAIALAPDGRIWIGGNFSAWNGTPASNLVVLNGDLVEPAIVDQPDSQVVDPGTAVTFSVGVFSARPVTYQWFRNGAPLTDGGGISGATTADLAIASAALANEGDYTVAVSTDFFTAEPAPASLLVNDAPRILSEPAPAVVFAAEPLTLSAEVVALAPATFVWTKNGGTVTDTGTITGSGTATLEIGALSESDEGLYQLTVTNALGEDQTTAVFIEVVPPPAGISPIFAGLAAPTSAPTAILPLPDGRTLVAVNGALNDRDGANSTLRLHVVNADGLVDDAISLNGIAGNVRAMLRQPDGKIIITGDFTTVFGQPRNRIARLNADFTLDSTFDAGEGPNSGQTLGTLALDAAGNLYVGGSFSSWNGNTTYAYLVRLRKNGELDTSFAPGLINTASKVAVLPDGRILVGGSFNQPRFRIVLLHPDGTPDTSFAPNVQGNVGNFALTSDGKVYLPNGTTIRRHFLSDGSVDDTFTLSPLVTGQSFPDFTLQADGKLVAVGSVVARFHEDGSLDAAFASGTSFNPAASLVTIDGRGRLWVGGGFSSYNNQLASRILVLNGDEVPLAILASPADAAVEPAQPVSFSVIATGTSELTYQWLKNGQPLSDGGRISGSKTATLTLAFADPNDGGAYSVRVSNDSGNKTSAAAELVILAGPEILGAPEAVAVEAGLSATFRVEARGVAPLTYQWFLKGEELEDGAEVSGATTAELTLTGLTVEDSGNVHVRVSNPLDHADSDPVPLLVQLLPSGMDRSIVLPVSVSGTIYDVLPADDGSYIIGGLFQSVSHVNGSATRRYLARFNADGSLDATFPQVNGSGSVNVLARAPDGKIYLGGGFTQLSFGATNVTRNRIARLNADGSLDASFDPGAGPASQVKDIFLLPDGKILIGGEFNGVAGQPGTAYIARLNADGTVDATFTSLATNFVNRIVPHGDGTFWLACGNYGGLTRIVRIAADGAVAAGFSYPGNMTSRGVVPLGDGTVISYSNNWPYLQKLSANGSIVAGWPGTTPGADVGVAAAIGNGRTLVTGEFRTWGSQPLEELAVILADGTLDPGFDAGSGLTIATAPLVEAIRPDSAGRIWIAGNFTTYKGENVPRLIVLNGFGTATGGGDSFEDYLVAAGVPANLRGAADDADGDGIANLIEFLFGSDPADGGSRPAPVPAGSAQAGAALNASHGMSLDAGKHFRVVEIVLPKDLRGTNVTLEAGLGLTDFGTGATATEVGTRTDNGDTETRRYVLTPAMEDAPTMFWRLAVSQ